jgi:hypothetical protein
MVAILPLLQTLKKYLPAENVTAEAVHGAAVMAAAKATVRVGVVMCRR